MNLQEYAEYDALGLAELVRKGDVSAANLLAIAEELVTSLNPKLNAVTLMMLDHAKADLDRGLPAGPLSGVPFLLKDLLVSYGGVPTNSGSRLFEGWTRPHDSEILKRWREAGLVVMGKTNTPELGSSGSTEPLANGATHNPWKLGYTTGGSSGGSAAAVASGMVPVAHANDGGGSIRGPASCCGLVGLKPTRGRNPLGPDAGQIWEGLVIEHVVSRTVRDCAAFLDVTSGPDVGDPYAAPALAGFNSFLEATQSIPTKLRIGFSEGVPSGRRAHKDCSKALHSTVDTLINLGHELVEAEPDHDRSLLEEVFMTIFAAHGAHAIDSGAKLLGRTPSVENLEQNNIYLLETGRKITADQLLTAVDDMNMIARRFAQFFQQYDIWLTPTMAEPPPKHGHLDANMADSVLFFERLWRFNTANTIYNVSGNPAISLPLHITPDNLPIGVMLGSKFGNEALLISLASQLEEALPWNNRHPDVSAWNLTDPNRS